MRRRHIIQARVIKRLSFATFIISLLGIVIFGLLGVNDDLAWLFAGALIMSLVLYRLL